jgi:hypothetical protein
VSRVASAASVILNPMAVEFADIDKDFDALRSFILNDLDQIVALKTGANYGATALITCGHETLAALRDPQAPKHATFAESLPTVWQPVAQSLYDALRNGIVHGYATKRLIVNAHRIELSVSWRKERHLSLDAESGVLYLNVQQMATDLRDAFARYEDALRTDAAARRSFQSKRRKAREVQPQGEQKAAWLRLLGSAPLSDRRSRDLRHIVGGSSR